MSPLRRRLLTLLLAAAAIPAPPARAQTSELLRIDSLLDRSRFTEARTSLQRWLANPATARGPDDDAHALLLQARLTGNADSALVLYLQAALAHPSSPRAPEALLRLGQGHLALGHHQQAAGYLERLRRDYPGFPGRPVALLWLVRAQRAARQPATACATLAQAVADPDNDPGTSHLLRLEQAACQPGPTATQPASGNFAVQLGAFRDRAAAESLARTLRAAGIDARVVFVGEGTLATVRAGRFRTRAEAAGLLERARRTVPGAIVVDDTHRERAASR